MELMEIIKKRQSIRAYGDKPLPEDIVAAILEAARLAPSARNLQQLEYKVITNKELIQRLSAGITQALREEAPAMKAPPMFHPSFFYDAPLLIVITAPKDNPWGPSDAALAVENIMLYATSVGLGSCFIGMAKFIERDEALLGELHITGDRQIAAAVICGYADEKPAVKEKKLNAEFFE
jgi:nitroreductase